MISQGEQRLTQEVFDNFVFYWESLFDLKFTGEEREELKRAVIGYWKTNNKTEIQNTLQQAESGATNREMGESFLSSRREAYQASTIAEVRKETNDPVAVVLVRAFDRAHGFGGAPTDQASAGAVIAEGNPPLMQAMVNKFFTFYEFILDLKFTAEQRERLQKVILEGWRKNDRQVIERVVNDLEFVAQKSKDEVKTALGADYQLAIVSDMRRYSGNPLLAQLAEDFDQAHPDRREATRAKGFADLVGKWEWSDALLQERNPYSGNLQGIGYVDAGTLEISPNGQFKLIHTHRHCAGTCCNEQGKSENGTISVESGELVFQINSGTEMSRDGCNTRLNQQTAIKPHRESYNWSIRLNPNHDNAPTLCWNTGPHEATCYIKQQ
jgi:hypothetical protein